ncbi:MAG: phenylalanine--tRNA ligase subunit beta, partial [Bacteroidota bacterium]|nr:phenylalanine--tRNA ligase subunit beta [Bacteroidota bacterium]
KNIFLESALFDSVYIRKTAKHHALQTDASYRFERGVDPEMTLYALKRAAILIKEITGGEISSEIVDLYPEKIKKAEVNLSYKNAERLIGTKIPKEDIKRILNALEIEVEQETEEELRLKIPTYRIDVTREADVIEEILRIYGYNNIEVSHKVKSAISYEKKPNKNKLQNIVSDFLSADGFSEAMSNSLTKSEYYKKMPAFNHEQSVKILNPLSNDLDVMRQSLIFGGLEAIKRNINHRNENIRLYEFGNVYQFSNTENGALENYTEKEKLAVFLSGNKNEKHWKTDEQKFSFYDLKSHVERILTRIGFDTDSLNVTETDNKNFALGISIRLNKKIIAEYGQLSTVLCKHFDIEQDVFYAEFYLSNLIASLPANATYKKISKYPSVRRDLALLVDKSIRFEQIKTIAEKANKKLLKKTDVFDIFEDKKLGKGKKSYAVSFIFQDEQKTLKDKQINKIMDKIIKNCQSELGAEIR